VYSTSFLDSSVAVRGHLDLVDTGRGWQPRRLPRAAWEQFPLNDWVLPAPSQTSGVRLEFRTAATQVELLVMMTEYQTIGFSPAAAVVRFNLVVDRVIVATARPSGEAGVDAIDPVSGANTSVPGELNSVVFAGLPVGDKFVQIWLPVNVAVELVELRTDEPVTAAPPSAAPVWVHHGSSISHCTEASSSASYCQR
jgi:hypothetical protein